MDKYFIAFEPEKKLNDKVASQKETVNKLAGEQNYLSHPPHTTLVVFCQKNLDKIKETLETLSKTLSPISVDIKGISVFYDDKFSGGNTIHYRFEGNESENMKKTQVRVIEKIKESVDKNAYLKEFDLSKVSQKEKEDLEKYGYPYVGNNWIPHVTVSSVEKSKFDVVFDKLKKEEIKGVYLLDSIALYKVDDPSVLIKRYPLK